MNPYFDPSVNCDEDLYLDYPVKEFRHGNIEEFVPCHVCKQHGGWNLSINCYKLRPNVPDTPENRHNMVHFRAMCNQCWGHGWLRKGSKDHTCLRHEWKKISSERCCHQVKCIHCGVAQFYDSSD